MPRLRELEHDANPYLRTAATAALGAIQAASRTDDPHVKNDR